MRFANPPLVELIAELRWSVAAAPMPLQGNLGLAQLPPGNASDEFFMRFGAKVAPDGFDSFERIVPSGFPTFLYQPVYRYRYGAPDKGTALYQLGSGLFTANITPPYDNWEMFKPVVAQGIEALLKSRSKVESNTPFSVCSLRYIDAFRADLTNGRTTAEFAREVLGFTIEPPPIVKQLMVNDGALKPAAEFLVPLAKDLAMILKVGDGNVNGEPAIILDTVVTLSREIEPSSAAALAAFDSAHALIRTMFVDMTKGISALMKPQEE